MRLHFHFSKLPTLRLLYSYTHYNNAQSNKVKNSSKLFPYKINQYANNMSHSIHLANTLSNLNSKAAGPLNANERKQLVIHNFTCANFFNNGFFFHHQIAQKVLF